MDSESTNRPSASDMMIALRTIWVNVFSGDDCNFTITHY